MQATKLKSPARDRFSGQASPRSGVLAFLSRSATTTSSSSKCEYRGAETLGGDEIKGKKMTMLTRGASFRRQGSSGMTWADNWIFTDDGMFLGRHAKGSDDKGSYPTAQDPKKMGTGGFPTELQRSQSVGSVRTSSTTNEKHRSHHRSSRMWGFKWIKKNFRKAFYIRNYSFDRLCAPSSAKA